MGNGDCSYSWLDELLCEYVDGTMDPGVRVVFEEYLRTDPVLAQQAECLCHTRTLLCRHGCRVRTPRGLQARVRRRLASEMVYPQPPYVPQTPLRLGAFVAVGSVAAALVVAGMVVGALGLAPQTTPVADRTPTPPLRQETLGGLYPAAMMTPLGERAPLGLPSFARRPAATPLLLTSPASEIPVVFPNARRQDAALQRTDGIP